VGPWAIIGAFVAAQAGGGLLIAALLGVLAAHTGSPQTLTQWSVRLTYGLSSLALLAASVAAVVLSGPRPRPGAAVAVAGLWTWPGLVPLAAGVGGGLVLKLAGDALAAAERYLLGNPGTNNPLVLYPHAFAEPGLLAVLLFAVAVVAPVAEEVFFRGLLYGWLRGRLPVVPATLVAAVLFGAAHQQIGLVLPLAVVGAGLCLLYERWRTLWVPAAAHAVVNISSLLVALWLR